LSNWWIRTAAQDTFVLPTGTTVPAGQMLTLYGGKGNNSGLTFHWQKSLSSFQNLGTAGAVGGSVYLYDPKGNIRSHQSYPCVLACTDPAVAGKVRLTVDPAAEKVTITSLSSKTVDLSHRVLELNEETRELGTGTYLKPGEKMVIYGHGSGASSRLVHYWGWTGGPFMPNGGGVMVLRTSNTIVDACRAWGTGRC
jgi:Lamin Tail Domain